MSNGVLFEKGKKYGDDLWDDEELIKAYDRAVSNMKDHLDLNGDENHPKNMKKSKKNKKSKNKNKSASNSTVNRNHDVSFNEKEWQVGDKCAAIFVDDGVLYNAIIKYIDVENSKCIISYSGYGNIEEKYMNELVYPEESLIYSTNENMSEEDETVNVSQLSSECSLSSTPISGRRSPVPPHSTSPPKRRSRRNEAYNKHISNSHVHNHAPHCDKCLGRSSPANVMMPPPHPPLSHFYKGFGPSPATAQLHHFTDGFSHIPPPPPVIDEEPAASDSEALYSMLMSWYLNGYHTGYYQGMKHGETAHNRKSNKAQKHDNQSRHHHYHQH